MADHAALAGTLRAIFAFRVWVAMLAEKVDNFCTVEIGKLEIRTYLMENIAFNLMTPCRLKLLQI